jgi:hypothetical protein
MDIPTLTALAMTAMLTFLKGEAGGSSKKASKALAAQGKSLYDACQIRFGSETDADRVSQALSNLASNPDARLVVEQKLAYTLLSEPSFAVVVRDIIQAGPRQTLTAEEEAAAQRIREYLSANVGKEKLKRKHGAPGYDRLSERG